MAFEERVRVQRDLAKRILNFWLNMTKDKSKLSTDVLRQRVNLLHQYWNTFFHSHQILMRYREAATSTYKQNDLFTTVEEAYVSIMAKLNQALTKATKNQSSVQPQLSKMHLPMFVSYALKRVNIFLFFNGVVQKLVYINNLVNAASQNSNVINATERSNYKKVTSALQAALGTSFHSRRKEGAPSENSLFSQNYNY